MAANSRHESGTDTPPPLVEAKLAVPSVRHRVVDRPRVRRALDAGRDASLTLVAAPAGYGKTTAVRDWCASLDAALAWVVLDAGDNDPVLLWRYVATAVDRVRPGLGRGALRRLGVAGSPVEVAVDELMNGAAALRRELVIVLDDLHAVTSRGMPGVDRLRPRAPSAEHARGPRHTRRSGAQARASARRRCARRGACRPISRSPPPRRTSCSWFSVISSSARRRSTCSSSAPRAGPRRSSSPWLWLRTVDDPARAVRAFGGDHRFVADYLSSEVLAALDEDERAFLHGVAVLGEFTAELCDGVLDRTDSAARLAELEHSNLFVSRLERGGWFRIHSLFAEYARAQLAALEPGAPTRIHRRAAEWLRSRGLPVEAVDHAAAAGDHELVAQLLVEYHLPSDQRRRQPDAAALGSDAAGRPDRRASGACGGGRDGHGAGRREHDRAAPVAAARRRGPWRATGASRATSRRRRGWCARVTIDGGVRAGGARRPACGRAGGGRRGRDPHGSAGRLRPRALLRRRARRGVGGGGADPRASGDRAARPEPGGRPLDARPRRASSADGSPPHEATPRRRRPRWAGSARAGAGSGPTRPPPSARCWPPREASSRQSAHLASAERFFRDEVATLHHTWLLVLLARVRLRRGRLGEAEATLRSAREALDELVDSGPVPALADEVRARARDRERPRVQRGDARAAERGRARRAAAPGHRPVDP